MKSFTNVVEAGMLVGLVHVTNFDASLTVSLQLAMDCGRIQLGFKVQHISANTCNSPRTIQQLSTDLLGLQCP